MLELPALILSSFIIPRHQPACTRLRLEPETTICVSDQAAVGLYIGYNIQIKLIGEDEPEFVDRMCISVEQHVPGLESREYVICHNSHFVPTLSGRPARYIKLKQQATKLQAKNAAS